MKKQDVQAIRRFVQGFPAVYETRTKGVSGADILEKQPNAKDGAGKPISKALTYTVKVEEPINHETKCKQIWQSETDPNKRYDKLEIYRESVMELAAAQAKREKPPEVMSV